MKKEVFSTPINSEGVYSLPCDIDIKKINRTYIKVKEGDRTKVRNCKHTIKDGELFIDKNLEGDLYLSFYYV